MRAFPLLVAPAPLVVLLLVGCAGAHPPAATTAAAVPVPTPAPVVGAPAEAPPVAISDEPRAPTCASAFEREGCIPDADTSESICSASDPKTAIGMFHAGTPWVRAYVTRNLESWDPSHRSRARRSQLALDEEVIVMRPYKPAGGVMLLGSTTPNGWTSVDVLRTDGSCVSLMADEIAMKRPPAPTHAPIAWEKVSDRTRDELLAAPALRKKADLMAKACANVTDKRCIQARVQLSDALVASSAPAQARAILAPPVLRHAARPSEAPTASNAPIGAP